MIRKPKADPCTDFWRTIRMGAAIAVLLFFLLPRILG